jgi:hypothetical protein
MVYAPRPDPRTPPRFARQRLDPCANLKRSSIGIEEAQMSVIAPDEKADFVTILHRHRLSEDDFMLQETDTTDLVDDVYPLRGHLTIVRKSTLKEKAYPIGHDTHWTTVFEKDLNKGAFG